MANDRIYFKCRHCGETAMLAKYWPSSGEVTSPDFIGNWVAKHMGCSPNFYDMDLRGDRCFDLFTESDDRFNDLYQPGENRPGSTIATFNKSGSGEIIVESESGKDCH